MYELVTTLFHEFMNWRSFMIFCYQCVLSKINDNTFEIRETMYLLSEQLDMYLTKFEFDLFTYQIHNLASFGGRPNTFGSNVISNMTTKNSTNPHAEVWNS